VAPDYETKSSYLFTANASNTLNRAEQNVTININKIGNIMFHAINSQYSYVNYDTNGSAQSVVISKDETKAYVADGSSGLQIIDITNPVSPLLLGTFHTGGYVSGVSLSSDDKKVYIDDAKVGIHNWGKSSSAYLYDKVVKSIDITDPNSPFLLAILDINITTSANVVSNDGTKEYIANGSLGLKIIDLLNPEPQRIVKISETDGYALTHVLSDDGTKTYEPTIPLDEGLNIINIDNPVSLSVLNSIDLISKNLGRVAFSSDHTKAYSVTTETGLKIIDLTTPDVRILGSVYAESYPSHLILSRDNTKAYVIRGPVMYGERYSNIVILDISQADFPKNIGSFSMKGLVSGITFSYDDTKAYLACGELGLRVLDVSNPESPTLIGGGKAGTIGNIGYSDYSKANFTGGWTLGYEYENGSIGGTAYDIAISQDAKKAYIAGGSTGVGVIDISNPESLISLGTIDTNGFDARRIALSKDATKAYISNESGELQTIDLTIDKTYKAIDFGNSDLELQVFSDTNATLNMNVVADRTDIVNIDNYDVTLTPDEYNNGVINIPISSISGKFGQTILTVSLTANTKTVTRTIYLNIYTKN